MSYVMTHVNIIVNISCLTKEVMTSIWSQNVACSLKTVFIKIIVGCGGWK